MGYFSGLYNAKDKLTKLTTLKYRSTPIKTFLQIKEKKNLPEA